MWQDLLAAFALVLVLEGILPFLSPRQFRQTMLTASRLTDRNLRLLGLGSMFAGVVALYIVR